jgi:hypothetical protein
VFFSAAESEYTVNTHLMDDFDSDPSTCAFLKRLVDPGIRPMAEFDGQIVFFIEFSPLRHKVAVNVPYTNVGITNGRICNSSLKRTVLRSVIFSRSSSGSKRYLVSVRQEAGVVSTNILPLELKS